MTNLAVVNVPTQYESAGSQAKRINVFIGPTSYTTGGNIITAKSVGLFEINDIVPDQVGGYQLEIVYVDAFTAKLKIYQGSGGGSISGTAAAQVFTGTLGTVPAETWTAGGSVMTHVLTNFTGTTAGTTTTITAGGAVVAANALAGGTVSDGTVESRIISNSALTATTGTIVTVIGLGAVITATGNAYQATGTNSTAAFTPAGTNGTSAVTGTSGAGAAVEVTNGTDLSALRIPFAAYGKA